MTNQGTFIVLEGVDGSGKGTQFRLLTERLKAVGYEVEVFDFPRYNEQSSHFVKRYLNGEYGPASEISPYSASLFYALDRFEASTLIRKALADGKVVLSNRYVGSNMAHQGSKFGTEAEQRGFFIWADSLEYQLLNIPRPNLNLFLRVPAETAFKLISEKSKREYTDKKRDEHEADINHLRRSLATYDSLCQLFPKDFKAINCTRNNALLSVPEINDLIWEVIKPILPPKPANQARESVVNLNQAEDSASTVSSEAADTESKKQISILGLEALLKDNGPNVKPILPWIEHARQGYHTPKGLNVDQQQKYQTAMNQLGKVSKEISKQLAEYHSNSKKPKKLNELEINRILANLLPLSTLCEVNGSVNIPKDSELLAKQSAPDVLEKLAQKHLSTNLSTSLEPITLVNVWPRNEFEILADSLYGSSDLPRLQLQDEIETWTYSQKRDALLKILQKKGSTMELARYRFDLIIDQITLLELLTYSSVQNLEIQTPTPRYGYDIPEDIEIAGLEQEYISGFDISLGLYSELQTSTSDKIASYATLLGHKVRVQFTIDFKNLLSVVAEPSMKRIGQKLVEKISENHPLTSDYLRLAIENTKTSKVDYNSGSTKK